VRIVLPEHVPCSSFFSFLHAYILHELLHGILHKRDNISTARFVCVLLWTHSFTSRVNRLFDRRSLVNENRFINNLVVGISTKHSGN